MLSFNNIFKLSVANHLYCSCRLYNSQLLTANDNPQTGIFYYEFDKIISLVPNYISAFSKMEAPFQFWIVKSLQSNLALWTVPLLKYHVAWNFCRSFILQIGDFLCFAGTICGGSRWLKFLLGTNFCDFLSNRQNINRKGFLIFSIFITWWLKVRST